MLVRLQELLQKLLCFARSVVPPLKNDHFERVQHPDNPLPVMSLNNEELSERIMERLAMPKSNIARRTDNAMMNNAGSCLDRSKSSYVGMVRVQTRPVVRWIDDNVCW